MVAEEHHSFSQPGAQHEFFQIRHPGFIKYNNVIFAVLVHVVNHDLVPQQPDVGSRVYSADLLLVSGGYKTVDVAGFADPVLFGHIRGNAVDIFTETQHRQIADAPADIIHGGI